jgi:hypothetical protein
MSLTNRALVLAELKTHPSWEELGRVVAERKEAFYRSMTKRLIAGALIDQREIDRAAGYYEGLEDLLRAPDKAENKMRRAHERAERGIAAEGASE